MLFQKLRVLGVAPRSENRHATRHAVLGTGQPPPPSPRHGFIIFEWPWRPVMPALSESASGADRSRPAHAPSSPARPDCLTLRADLSCRPYRLPMSRRGSSRPPRLPSMQFLDWACPLGVSTPLRAACGQGQTARPGGKEQSISFRPCRRQLVVSSSRSEPSAVANCETSSCSVSEFKPCAV